MIKFFRNIRKKLIMENQSVIRNTNYFKYAIGEIILVVIGILIALQVNNWNEKRKDNIAALKLLNSLKEEIEQDSLYFNTQYKFEKEICLKASQILFEEHSKETLTTEYDENIGSSFRFATFTPIIKFSDNTYKDLSASKLLDNFKSKTLKKSLLAYYDQINFLNRYSDEIGQFVNDLIFNLDEYYTIFPSPQPKDSLLSEFLGAGEESFTTRYDLKSFRDNKSLNPKLYELVDIHKDRLGAIENVMHLNQTILEVINDELKVKK